MASSYWNIHELTIYNCLAEDKLACN